MHTYPITISDDVDLGVADIEVDGTITKSTPLDAMSSEPLITGNGLIDKDDPLQAAERRRRNSPLHNRICADCDPTCLRCYGPNIYQCSTCPPGSQLRKLALSNETYCYAYVVRSTMDESNAAKGESHQSGVMQYMHLSTALLVIAVNVTVIGVIAVAALMYYRRTSKDDVYTRVALIADDESDEEHEVDVFTARKDPSNDVLEYHDEVPSSQHAREALEGAAPDAVEMEDVKKEETDGIPLT